MKKLAIILAAVAVSFSAVAGDWAKRLDVEARAAYGIGGTAPVGMPATIRALNSYTPQFNPMIGVDATLPLSNDGRWGVMAGLQFENKAMDEDAQVKNYHMEITRGGQTLAGMFTGDVKTKVTEWMFTIPVQATFLIDKVNLKMGPYVSLLVNRDFSGWAHNGYLRVDDPTGAKVELGEAQDERGEYDFTSSMRRAQMGINVGADWHLNNKFGLFADLSWGLTGVHKSSFKTIEQTLYPIYGKIGVTYRIK